MLSRVKLDCASATYAGVDRAPDDNEDGAWIAADQRACALLDGVSGATGSGRFATALAIESLQRSPTEAAASLADRTRARLQRASAHINAAQGRWPYGSGFGCAAVLLELDEDELAISWAGDGRALLVRDERAWTINRPHDLRWLLERDQQWSMIAQKPELPPNVLCSLLGTGLTVIETGVELALREDLLIVCTASVVALVPDDELVALARAARTTQAAADAIIARTIERRSAINATTLVARVQR